MNQVNVHSAPTRKELGNALAKAIASQLQQSIDQCGTAVLAVSGGSTPAPFFAALQNQRVDWSAVVITLVDERWVPASHTLSNEALVREHFLEHVPGAKFVPLYQPAATPAESLALVLDDYCQATGSDINAPRPLDAVVLGMGGDGHTASFFPDATNIDKLVSMSTQARLLSCESPSTQVPRVTWSAPSLLNTQYLALHFCGVDKWQVYQKACQAGPVAELPIRVALHQQTTPLHIFYAE